MWTFAPTSLPLSALLCRLLGRPFRQLEEKQPFKTKSSGRIFTWLSRESTIPGWPPHVQLPNHSPTTWLASSMTASIRMALWPLKIPGLTQNFWYIFDENQHRLPNVFGSGDDVANSQA